MTCALIGMTGRSGRGMTLANAVAAARSKRHNLSVIRFMGEHTVDVPLWDDDGLSFGTPEELMRSLGPLGLTAGLVKHIVTWAREWETRSGEPDHDAEAARLVRRLNRELGGGVAIVYQP